MAMTASLKEMVRPVSIPPPFESSCGALMQVSFGRPSSHTTKKRDRVRRDASSPNCLERLILGNLLQSPLLLRVLQVPERATTPVNDTCCRSLPQLEDAARPYAKQALRRPPPKDEV